MDLGLSELVVLGIVLSRLLVPLLIIRFPLPAIVASLVIDAVDQTVFQALVPRADLSGYPPASPRPRRPRPWSSPASRSPAD